MRRRHLLAAVLTVAATVCIASFWWEMWLVVAYEKKVDAQGVAYLEKRFGWIPGSYWVARNQTCKAVSPGQLQLLCAGLDPHGHEQDPRPVEPPEFQP